MGGPDKPFRPVAGQPMLERVLHAVDDASARVVVGAPDEDPGLAPACRIAERHDVREVAALGGPVAATAAGLVALGAAHPAPFVAVFAADLPLLNAAAVTHLRATLAADPTGEAAVFVDDTGHRQYLCALWRTDALLRALTGAPPDGRPMRDLYAAAQVREVVSGQSPPPWFDCDTEADLHQAQEWLQ